MAYSRADIIWWTLARDTNSDNIVKVILPGVSTKVILPEVGSCQLLHNEAEGQAIVAAFNRICCEICADAGLLTSQFLFQKNSDALQTATIPAISRPG